MIIPKIPVLPAKNFFQFTILTGITLDKTYILLHTILGTEIWRRIKTNLFAKGLFWCAFFM